MHPRSSSVCVVLHSDTFRCYTAALWRLCSTGESRFASFMHCTQHLLKPSRELLPLAHPPIPWAVHHVRWVCLSLHFRSTLRLLGVVLLAGVAIGVGLPFLAILTASFVPSSATHLQLLPEDSVMLWTLHLD